MSKNLRKQIEELIYFRQIEKSLQVGVDLRVEGRQKEIFEKIQDTLSEEGKDMLAQNELMEIREADDEQLREGSFDSKTIESYVDLVRREVLMQVQRFDISQEDDEGTETPVYVYEKAAALIDFLADQITLSDGSKEYLKAYLYKQIRSNEGNTCIKSIFQTLHKHLLKSSNESRVGILSMIADLQKKALMGWREEQIMGALGEASITREELTELLSYGRGTLEPISYAHMMGQHLEDLECTKFWSYLQEKLDNQAAGGMEKDRDKINNIIQLMKNTVEKFRDEVNQPETLIERLPAGVADEGLKNDLRAAANAYLDENRGTREQLSAILKDFYPGEGGDDKEKRNSIKSFLAAQEQLAIEGCKSRGTGGGTLENLEEARRNDSGFSIYQYRKTLEQESSMGSEERDRNQFIGGEVLSNIQERMDKMQEISRRHFSQAEDFAEYEKLMEQINTITQGQHYLCHNKLVYDENGKVIAEDTTVTKKLPFEDRVRLMNLIRSLSHHRRYEAFIKMNRQGRGFAKNELMVNESTLRAALGAIFAGYHQLSGVNGAGMRSMTKIMALHHPTTCLRFHAVDKVPFEHKTLIKGSQYEVHKMNGDIVSFRERSAFIIEKISDMVKNGNFVGIDRLFEEDQEVDCLWKDVRFFPKRKLWREIRAGKKGQQGKEGDTGVTYKLIEDKNGKKKKVLSEKIPEELQKRFDGDAYDDIESELISNSEFASLGGELTLNEETDFRKEFGIKNAEEIMALLAEKDNAGNDKYPHCLMDTAGKTPQEEKLSKLSREYPDIFRAMTENEEELVLNADCSSGGMLGAALKWIGEKSLLEQYGLGLGGATLAWCLWKWGAKKIASTDVGSAVMHPIISASAIWKDMKFYSVLSMLRAPTQYIEHFSNYYNLMVDLGTYELMMNSFSGTIIGSEFAKLYQQKYDERVNQFKDTFKEFGRDQLWEKLYDARDQFELKAILIHGFEDRGLFSMDDLLDNRLFKLLNRYTNSKLLPLYFTKEQMQDDSILRSRMILEVKAAIDDIWGQGTFRAWTDAGISKFNSKSKEAETEAHGQSNAVTEGRFHEIFNALRTPAGVKQLKIDYHPAEILGFIHEDLKQGDMDSWMSYGILQGLIIERVITNEDFLRLQGEHASDKPIYAIMQYGQCKTSGLDKHWQACKMRNNFDVNDPFFGFFQGSKTLKIGVNLSNGKWTPVQTQADVQEATQNGTWTEMDLTGADIQANREFQLQYHRKIDNSCTALAGNYPIGQVLQAMPEDTNGMIQDFRPHEATAKLRGYQIGLAAIFEAMESGESQISFDRHCFQAYLQLLRLYRFVGHLSAHSAKSSSTPDRKIYPKNIDGSPSSLALADRIYDGSVNKSGRTNFESLILSVSGAQNRVVSQGSPRLEKVFAGKGAEAVALLKAVKEMSGLSFLEGIGDDGKKDASKQKTYTCTWNVDTCFKPALSAMVQYMKILAEKNSRWRKPIVCNFANAVGDISNAAWNGVKYDDINQFKNSINL